MATSEESKHCILQLCLVGTAGLVCIVGLMIHIFIIGVSITEKLKGRPLATTDLLITSIGTSRIIFELMSLFSLFLRTFVKQYSAANNITITVIGCSATDCNIWLSVLLSVFYTLKISNFHNVTFLYLKKMISRRVLGLIITIVLLSSVFSLGRSFPTFVDNPKNITQSYNLRITEILYSIILLWDVLPILFYAISFFTLLGSLCHHMQRMKRGRSERSHLDAYFKTIAFIIVSFFCFALYVGMNIFRLYYNSISFAVILFVWNCFPVLHSIYIIYMTVRLRNHFFDLLHSVTKCHCLRGGSASGSVGQIQMISQ